MIGCPGELRGMHPAASGREAPTRRLPSAPPAGPVSQVELMSNDSGPRRGFSREILLQAVDRVEGQVADWLRYGLFELVRTAESFLGRPDDTLLDADPDLCDDG